MPNDRLLEIQLLWDQFQDQLSQGLMGCQLLMNVTFLGNSMPAILKLCLLFPVATNLVLPSFLHDEAGFLPRSFDTGEVDAVAKQLDLQPRLPTRTFSMTTMRFIGMDDSRDLEMDLYIRVGWIWTNIYEWSRRRLDAVIPSQLISRIPTI
jgi:hypothetical protein